ncbi:N-6 DNA methylase [Microbacterium sp. M3]|uniref:site-specific DNA-methyltransferase (adenine-specific) n=1 Tax=Microbacterium arthrosphaerae TaxID=792652 RepID=A0ABU4GZW2_9MICO|nr:MULTISPECIES: N-6 DNA methylase [Microbacterium]MDW4572593.1 N-6 DNA methylase [Microbacterium arthrosphaerae]MDW7606448.1 N-6 DNA methylase [Microbacterium sp. M3]
MPADLPYAAIGSDPAKARKARGAFYTDDAITTHLATWAVREASDSVLEPSAGEAAFLKAAVQRMAALGADRPTVHGVEIHRPAAVAAGQIVGAAGGVARITVNDFFLVPARPIHDAVIGNPPFIRYQDWTGAQRDRARFAALQQGVALTGLASSWAPFVVHAAAHLKPGGRLGMVLPAELLTVNYAAPVRRFLLENFSRVELVVFDEQVFPDAEADTVLVKADGWKGSPAGVATLRQTRNASTLSQLEPGVTWTPRSTTDRWLAQPLRTGTLNAVDAAIRSGRFGKLQDLGETSLGAVTGANRYFTLSPERVKRLGIPMRDLVKISPPGSAHLRGLALSDSALRRLGREGESTWLLYPSDRPSEATLRYISEGADTGVSDAYKCRVRKPWFRVPVLSPPDLFLTYMNADTVRLVTNDAGAHHLNSVHGVYLREDLRELAREVLPIASLNSMTLLGAEYAGRSYGGGILKLEPREADEWWMPSAALLRQRRSELLTLKPTILRMLRTKNLLGAVAAVDEVVLRGVVDEKHLSEVRADRHDWMTRRTVRGKSGK